MARKKAETEAKAHYRKTKYLWDGGWLINQPRWWHPPSCLASWPLDEAYQMAKKDEASGQRMKPEEVAEYLAAR